MCNRIERASARIQTPQRAAPLLAQRTTRKWPNPLRAYVKRPLPNQIGAAAASV